LALEEPREDQGTLVERETKEHWDGQDYQALESREERVKKDRKVLEEPQDQMA